MFGVLVKIGTEQLSWGNYFAKKRFVMTVRSKR